MTEHFYRRIQWGLLGLPVVGATVWVSLHLHDLGFRILEVLPSNVFPQLALDYTMGLLWWSVLAIGILVFGGDSRRMLLLAWVGKFFVVLVAMLFYEHHYGLDAFSYFQLKLTGYHDWFPFHDFRNDLTPSLELLAEYDDPLQAANIGHANSLRFILLIAAVTGPFYHAMKVGCAFMGFLGVWWFYRAVVVALGRPYPPVFYLLAFFPSIIFWSSILGKDPLQFFFLGLYAYGGAVWFVQGRPAALWLIGAGLLGSYLIRPWTALMAGSALVLATLLGRARGWQVGLLTLAGGSLLFLAGKYFLTLVNLTDQALALEFMESQAKGFAGETQRVSGSGADLPDVAQGGFSAASLVLVIFTGLFRPLPFEITNPLTALAAVENTVVLLLALAALSRFRLAYLRDPLVLWPAIYCLTWATLYGLIVMANFGSGARFKLQMWPFFLLLLSSLTHREGRALLASRVPGRGKALERTEG